MLIAVLLAVAREWKLPKCLTTNEKIIERVTLTWYKIPFRYNED